jgi:voltage-gated potassium channel
VRENVVSADAATQYIRSLYWVIVTTTTVGFGDITPRRNVEYVFSMGVILLGASMYAFVIGSIASLVSRIDGGKAAFWDRVENVTAYLRARRVPAAVNAHVRSYYEYVWATYRGTDQQSLLRDLPPPMRLDVLMHLTSDLLVHVPLFRHCSHALRDVLLLALRPAIYAPGDAIVREGEYADGVYFISRGTVEVVTGEGRRGHGSLGSGDHFGDLSLLLNEPRTGAAVATTFCDVFVLPRREFERIKEEHAEFREVLRLVAADRSEKMEALVLEGVVL